MPKEVDPMEFSHVQADPAARKVVLSDWNPERDGAIEAALSAVSECIDVTFPDGRTVSLEFEDGAIRIHAASGEIVVEREGYDADPKWSNEELDAQEAAGEAPESP